MKMNNKLFYMLRAGCELQSVRMNAAYMQEAYGAFSVETLDNFKTMKL